MKAILKDISVYSVGEILSKGIGFVSIVFYTHLLSQNEIGLYGYISIIMYFVTIFINLGLDNAYARYFFEYKEKIEQQILTTTLLVFLFVWSSGIISLIVLFINDISNLILGSSEHAATLSLAFLSIILRSISSIMNQTLRNQFKTKLFVVINFFNSTVCVTLSIIFLAFTDLKISAIFLGFICGDLVVLVIRLYAIRDFLIKRIDFSILQKLLMFGLPFLPTALAYWIFSSADRIMLEKMVGLEHVAIYTVALSFTSVLAIISSAIGQAWSPHIVKIYEDDKENIKEICDKFLKNLIILLIFVIFIAAMLGKEIIVTIFPETYSKSFYPMLLLLFGTAYQMTTQVTAIGISLAKKTIYFLYISLLIALINIFLNYLFIPEYKEVGAAFATMLSNQILTFIYAFITNRLIGLNLQYRPLLMGMIFIFIIISLSLLPVTYRILILINGLIVLFLKRKVIFRGLSI